MRKSVQCVTCGAVYYTTCADGMAYYHACPPLRPSGTAPLQEQPNKRDENLTVDRTRMILHDGSIVAAEAVPHGVVPISTAIVPKSLGLGTRPADLAPKAPG